MEIDEFNVFLTTEMPINFCKSDVAQTNWQMCDNCKPRRPVIEKQGYCSYSRAN